VVCLVESLRKFYTLLGNCGALAFLVFPVNVFESLAGKENCRWYVSHALELLSRFYTWRRRP
jgi:hypothetical protein